MSEASVTHSYTQPELPSDDGPSSYQIACDTRKSCYKCYGVFSFILTSSPGSGHVQALVTVRVQNTDTGS